MNTIINDLKSRRTMVGMSWGELAAACHKDISTVQKQLAEDANPTLATLVQIAEVLGADVRVVTPESIAASVNNDVEVYRARLLELQEQLDQERARVERRNATIAEMTESAKRKERMVETMYESIEEKDKMIAKLLKDTGRV